MKKIKVIIKDKTILELVEDGSIGDQIDLTELEQLDLSYIENIIESGKDKVYESKLEQQRKILEADYNAETVRLKSEIEQLRNEHKTDLKLKENELDQKYHDQIKDLERKIESLEEQHKLNITTAVNEEKNKYALLESQIETKVREKENEVENKYRGEIDTLKNQVENDRIKNENDKVKADLEKEKEISRLKDQHTEELRKKDALINDLQRQKASLHNKQTGEDLEGWCDDQVSQFMQNGLFNCVWHKDNKSVKNDEEVKGSKADFIFKVYADEKHNESELLTSVCLEMKDENPDSKTKQTNEQFYKKLDSDRKKKECKYALLVSNLEMEKTKFTPIYKVPEYEDMYVVRPTYMMAFLNMIASLTTRFAKLILSEKEAYLELKDKLDLIEKFNEIKEKYLDKPLTQLSNEIEAIQKSTEGIRKAANSIDASCEKITNNYINKINDKLSKFELEMNKKIVKNLE